jgi:N-acetylmuramoyl-L-alanine amidase
MKIANHRLVHDDGTPYAFRDTPNKGGVITPRWLVMHYTAGGSASESIGWLANPDAKASAHVVIAKDGTVTQMVDFNRRAWHAGESTWKGVDGLNGHSIGIELDGFGFLGNAGPGKWKFRSTSIPDSEVVVATHKLGKPSGGWP